jgi:hypothetical protein
VNLGSLSKDVSLAKAAAQQAATPSNYTPSSFAGLDGFGKSQSMVCFHCVLKQFYDCIISKASIYFVVSITEFNRSFSTQI